MTTQLRIDLISFKCLKLKLAITILSTSIIISPTDSICTRYQVANAFLVCQQVCREGLLRSVPTREAVILPIAVVRIWNQPGFFCEMVCKVHPEKNASPFLFWKYVRKYLLQPFRNLSPGTLLRPPHSGVYIRLREQLIEEILIWK